MTNEVFQDHLAKTLAKSQDGGKFSARLFFKNWFVEQGRAYFFLFRKNLRITNMQVAELMALIKANINSVGDDGTQGTGAHNVQFVTSKEFNYTVDQLVSGLPHDPETGLNQHLTASECYGSILRHAVVLDVYFGSCAVFVPPNLDIDIQSVCALSGYVHSCGAYVYGRSVDKADKQSFFKSIDRHLAARSDNSQPVFFTVYAHEDFTKFDRRGAPDLQNGLDDVKVYVEKFYMGNDSLVVVLDEMRKEFAGRLEIPAPGDYHEKHVDFRNRSVIDPTRTLWLIVDHSISSHPTEKGQERFYLCYDQLYVNENPFHIFDENKPAWIAHTTIPHTLAGAMLNITLPYWPAGGKVVLADPFSGTGTTWLESLKFDRVEFKATDIEAIAPLLASDNAAFFSADSDKLESYIDLLKEAGKHIKVVPSPNFVNAYNALNVSAYQYAIELINRVQSPGEEVSFSFSSEVVAELKQKTPFERLLVYLTLRTALRHSTAFKRRSEDWYTAFSKESDTLSSQISDLRKMRDPKYRLLSSDGRMSTYAGGYSAFCCINPSLLAQWEDTERIGQVYEVKDARDLNPESCDVIISDPPYGFNVEHGAHDLATLYAEVLKTMVLALKDGGQLVLCLPEKSHTGRPLPLFTDKKIITQQILALAEEFAREVVVMAGSVPQPAEMFRPPYYWESERALRRSIVHFRIRKRFQNQLIT